VSTDPAAVQADDELLDNLGAGQVPDGDPVTTELAAWRADVDAEPIPEPRDDPRDLAQMVADRLTGNELIPNRWVILKADVIGNVIALRVVTWGSSVEPSARTEARYILKLVQEHPPAP